MSIQNLIRRPVATVAPTASCVEAARKMRRENVGSLVVEADGAPIGIVTDRDLMLRVLSDELEPASVPVSAVMSRFPAFLTTQRDLGDAIRLMREMRVRRLPAIDANGRAIGMLALDDVLVELAEQLDQIRQLLLSESNPPEAVSARGGPGYYQGD
jgi:CBS domain-containing protein